MVLSTKKLQVIPLPREARQKSTSGIYHIMLRGTNRQYIFHDDEDYTRFLETLDRYKKERRITIYGWCLMGNHIHLLLKEGQEDISVTMKRIAVSYAWFYNRKYNTVGHLFQDRFGSEKIEEDSYLLTVIRYIHQNPVKAKMVKKAEEWKWSSCGSYYGQFTYPPGIVEIDLILGMFSENIGLAKQKFKEFNEAINNDKCLDDWERKRLTDAEAEKQIKQLIPGDSIYLIKTMPKEQRDVILNKVKEIEGLRQRQAARILGISPNLIFKA